MADPTRRALIAAAAALPLVAVSGCNGVDVLASPPRQAPDVGLLWAAIAAEQLLVSQYAAVLRVLVAAVIATLAIMIGFGFALERVVLRPLLGRPVVAVIMATIGLAAVLRGLTSSGAGASAALTAALEPLLGQHRAHLAQLRSRLIVPAGGATPSPSARATRAPARPSTCG